MKDSELDALIAAHREPGNMRALARAVADAMLDRAILACKHLPLGMGETIGPLMCAHAINELRSER